MLIQFFTLLVVVEVTKISSAYDFSHHPNWHLFDHEHCGESLSDRIIGGKAATLGEFPWMARIGYTKDSPYRRRLISFKCGGSLINNMYVLTAAHCVANLNLFRVVLVRLGEHDVTTDIDCQQEVCAPPVQDVRVESHVYHHQYNIGGTMNNDIALIRLARPAQIHNYVNTICLPRGVLFTKNLIGESATVAGWGKADVKSRRGSDVLLHVVIPIVPKDICEKSIRGIKAPLSSQQLCAGGEPGYDSCEGDSGGPLMKIEALDGPPKYYVIGVVSYGTKTCGGKAPAVYTNVGQYMLWILDHIGP